MRKACLRRVLCYACCLSLVLGVFAYRPAKAEAVFVSPLAALGASLIASVVVGTTATFFVESGAADDIGDAIDFLLEEYISVMDELMGYTPQEICEIVGSGATLEDGAIRLSSRAGKLTAGFINWLQNVKGLSADDSSFDISVPGDYLVSQPYASLGFDPIPAEFAGYDICISYRLYYGDYSFVVGSSDCVYVVDGYPSNGHAFLASDVFCSFGTNYIRWFESTVGWASDANKPLINTGMHPACYVRYNPSPTVPGADVYACIPVWTNFNVYKEDDLGNRELFWLGEGCEVDAAVPMEAVTLSPNERLTSIPNVLPDQSSLLIGLPVSGLDLSDQQGAADMLMGAINAGTLSPSVTIEGQATDIPGTGTDDDTVIAVPGADADLLDWTKYIGQKVASIPKAIGQSVAEAVAAAFSPDPKLVNEITGAFSAKFGFVETLKHVGDDMFGMTAASEPPVVWIHLEDAEGRYDYGGTVKALDMSWYQRYKEDMDRILGGFLWIAYLWLLIKRAPDIISGAGMTLAESNYIDDFQMVSGQKILARRSKKLR